jgi:hypothetical protein
MSIQLIYSDIKTKRIVRVSEYTSLTCPADIEDTVWAICPTAQVSPDVRSSFSTYEFTVGRKFKKHETALAEEHVARFKLLDERIDCLEQLSKVLSNLRFTRANNMFGWQQLIPDYQTEIETYRATGNAGMLLMSMVDDPEDLLIAIAEFEIKLNTYKDFLINNEATWNKWSRKIKQSTQPKLVLDMFKQYTSS